MDLFLRNIGNLYDKLFFLYEIIELWQGMTYMLNEIMVIYYCTSTSVRTGSDVTSYISATIKQGS